MKITTLTLKTITATAVLTAAVGGCAPPENGKPFFPDDQPRSFRAVLNAQAANGAAEDATLYPRHFDAGQLSDLGKDKLYRIAEARHVTIAAVPVYLNLPGADATAERKDAVVAYLQAAGLPDDRIVLKVGPNPATARLATLTAGKLYEIRPDGIHPKPLGTTPGGTGSDTTNTEGTTTK